MSFESGSWMGGSVARHAGGPLSINVGVERLQLGRELAGTPPPNDSRHEPAARAGREPRVQEGRGVGVELAEGSDDWSPFRRDKYPDHLGDGPGALTSGHEIAAHDGEFELFQQAGMLGRSIGFSGLPLDLGPTGVGKL